MAKRVCVCALLVACAAKPAATTRPTFSTEQTLIAGTFDPGRGPDGNSVILDAPRGLIVIDTGRHTEHQDKLLAHAHKVGKPIAAIINTHWHLDHSGGNAELRAVYPKAEIIATNAIEGALVGFFPRGRANSDALLASGKATPEQINDIKLGRAAIDDPGNLRPTRPVTRPGNLDIAGRTLDVRVAPFAATEADLWIYDAVTNTVIAGDLVVASVPFFDTGCPEGWRKALDEIAAVPFERLIPGHGEPMTKASFATWHAAFNALLDCAASTAEVPACVAGWRHDAAAFIPRGDEARIDEFTTYYVAEILRSREAHDRFCKPLTATAD
jgi:glyoxylase-like metal-dependent hydrolase (beta-lactamase superfamily II)